VRIRVTTLHSPMQADSVRRALQQAADARRSFVGSVDQTSFELSQPTESSRGISPVIRGTIRALERGSEVRLVLRVNPLLGLVAAAALVAMALPLLGAYWLKPPWEAVLISSLLCAASGAALKFRFLADARKTETSIGHLVQGRRVAAAAEQEQP
jgi:hypothetical protein